MYMGHGRVLRYAMKMGGSAAKDRFLRFRPENRNFAGIAGCHEHGMAPGRHLDDVRRA
jgi:hypothetical protein